MKLKSMMKSPKNICFLYIIIVLNKKFVCIFAVTTLRRLNSNRKNSHQRPMRINIFVHMLFSFILYSKGTPPQKLIGKLVHSLLTFLA